MKHCTGNNLQLFPDWIHRGDQRECVWGFLGAAEGTSPGGNVGCPGNSRGPVSCWRGTPGSAAGSPAHACPAFSGPAELWLQAGCCSKLCRRSNRAAEETHKKIFKCWSCQCFAEDYQCPSIPSLWLFVQSEPLFHQGQSLHPVSSVTL